MAHSNVGSNGPDLSVRFTYAINIIAKNAIGGAVHPSLNPRIRGPRGSLGSHCWLARASHWVLCHHRRIELIAAVYVPSSPPKASAEMDVALERRRVARTREPSTSLRRYVDRAAKVRTHS